MSSSPPNAERALSSTTSVCASPPRKQLSDAVFACGLPHRGRGDLALFRKEFEVVQDKVAGLRRFGSAALDLAWVATGRVRRLLGTQLVALGHRGWPPAGARSGRLCDRPRWRRSVCSATGSIVAGNETMHQRAARVRSRAYLVAEQLDPGRTSPGLPYPRDRGRTDVAAARRTSSRWRVTSRPCLCANSVAPRACAHGKPQITISTRSNFHRPGSFLVRMLVFLVLLALLAFILYQPDLAGLPGQSGPQRADHRACC